MILTSLKSLLQMSLQCTPLVIAFRQMINAICITGSKKPPPIKQTRCECRRKRRTNSSKKEQMLLTTLWGSMWRTDDYNSYVEIRISRFTGEKENERRVMFLKSDSHIRNFLQPRLFFFLFACIRDNFSHGCKSRFSVSPIEREDPT